MAMGVPGCPECAACTASMLSVRMVLMANRASSSSSWSCFGLMSTSWYGGERAADGFAEAVEPRADVCAQVHPQDAPTACGQDGEVAERLSSGEHPHAVAPIGDRQIQGLVGSDLQEDAGVGTAFVQLTG